MAKREEKGDHLCLAGHSVVQKMLKAAGSYPETVQFSDFAIKINRKEVEQTRVLLITDRAMYERTFHSIPFFCCRLGHVLHAGLVSQNHFLPVGPIPVLGSLLGHTCSYNLMPNNYKLRRRIDFQLLSAVTCSAVRVVRFSSHACLVTHS